MKNLNHDLSLLHQFTDFSCEISINSPKLCSTYIFTDFFFTTMDSDNQWLTLGDNENRDVYVDIYLDEIVEIKELAGCSLVEIKLSNGNLVDVCKLDGDLYE